MSLILRELAFLDAFDLHDVFDGLERPAIDDCLRTDRADSGKDVQLFLRGGVDVDLLARLELGHVFGGRVSGLGGRLGGRLGVAVLAAAGAVVVTRSLRASIRDLPRPLTRSRSSTDLNGRACDDGLGVSRTDSRKVFERGRVGRIEIDLLGFGLRFGGHRLTWPWTSQRWLHRREPLSEWK